MRTFFHFLTLTGAMGYGGAVKVAILGASLKPERYSHQAQLLLMENGHEVFPVSPRGVEILEVPGFSSLSEVGVKIDTVTLYLGPERLAPLVEEVMELNPRRVIFNPGTESADAMEQLEKAGIECEEACTLVMLRAGLFEGSLKE
ncbi:MAG: CoA-binding protein [Akkermansiaceae bacterium]